MRAYQVFSQLRPEDSERIFTELSKVAPSTYSQAIALASATINARPGFVMRQKPARRAETMRRVLSRVKSNEVAEEVLASYFIESRREILIAWLDIVGLEHEDGILTSDNPEQPEAQQLDSAVTTFRRSNEGLPQDRELLLFAFAAQTVVDWPLLEGLLDSS